MSRARKAVWGLMPAVAGVVLVLDQLSKWLVVQILDLANKGQIEVWPPYLSFRMAWNRGVNFGLLSSESPATRWVLIGVALAISLWVVWWVGRGRLSRLTQASAGLLVGGALGNVIDRIAYGAVADFLNMSCCGFRNPWAFNIADVAIFAGAIGLALFTGKTGQETP